MGCVEEGGWLLRVVLGRRCAGRGVYVGGLFHHQDRELAERVKALGMRGPLDVYYRLLDFLGEPSAEEIGGGGVHMDEVCRRHVGLDL